jgi:uncharacterized membrane protein
MSFASQPHVLTAVFRNQSDAMRAYEWLRQHGYGLEEINVLLSEHSKQPFHAREHDDKLELKSKPAAGAQRRALWGALAGALLLALLALILSIMSNFTLHWPAALAGIGAGAMLGGLAGGLLGYGFPDSTARVYEPLLQRGGVAIGVKPHNSVEERIITSEFESLHGEDIRFA